MEASTSRTKALCIGEFTLPIRCGLSAWGDLNDCCREAILVC